MSDWCYVIEEIKKIIMLFIPQTLIRVFSIWIFLDIIRDPIKLFCIFSFFIFPINFL